MKRQVKTQLLLDITSLIFLFLAVVPAIRPLFHSGFFPMHDDQQVIRLAELDQALRAGQFPVRWVARLGFGYGYPLFNFYPPLVYYLGELFLLIFKTSYLTATKLVFASAFFFSAITMFYWAKHHLGRLPALLSALFYLYAPYRAVDAYVRGALAELFSFVWLPAILLAIDQLAQLANQKTFSPRQLLRWGGLLSLFYAGIIITHNLIALPFTGLMAIYFLSTLVKVKRKFLFFSSSFLFLALGVGLSAFFWLPALAEKSFTLVDQILLQERYTYSLHYVQPHQLWNSLWGYGGSAPPGEIDGFSLKIGKLHLLLSAAVLFLSFISIKSTHKLTKFIRSQSWFFLTCGLLLFFSAFLTTEYSSFIWDSIRPLHYIQFPWRFLTFTALFSSLLAGASLWLFQHFLPQPTFAISYLFLVTLLLALPNFKLFQPQTYLDVTDDHYLSAEFAKWKISKTSFEFIPKEVKTRIEPPLNITQPDINQDQVATTPTQVITGEITIFPLQEAPHTRSFSLSSPTGGVIQINTFNFPGWHAYLNGQELTIIDQNPLKLIQLAIPPGDHTLTLRFQNTLPRTFGNLLSLTSLFTLMVILTSTTKIPQFLAKS